MPATVHLVSYPGFARKSWTSVRTYYGLFTKPVQVLTAFQILSLILTDMGSSHPSSEKVSVQQMEPIIIIIDAS